MRISDWSSDVCSSDLLVQSKQAVDIIVMSQEVSRKRLSLVQPAVLGGDGLKLLDECVGWQIARHAYCPVIEYVNTPLDGNVQDRKSVVSGKSVSVRVDLGGRRIIKKKKKTHTN